MSQKQQYLHNDWLVLIMMPIYILILNYHQQISSRHSV